MCYSRSKLSEQFADFTGADRIYFTKATQALFVLMTSVLRMWNCF